MYRKAVPVSEVSESLESVQQRFAEWRATVRHRRPIPDDLWRRAAEQAQVLGVTRAAKALRLNAGTLKEHMPRDTSAGDRQAPVFVELPVPPTRGGCVVELTSRGGSKMRIEITGSASEELQILTDAFLRSSR